MDESNDSEQVSDHFICAVCLDILYKPVVLVCGHVSCFWCCYLSMDMRGQSHCPLCRHPYRHFPAICQTLDIFLKRMYPISYSRRKRQALEDEKQSSFCSALYEDHLSVVDQPSNLSSEDNLSINSSSTEENTSNDLISAANCKQVTVADVLCAACKQLLFRPAVLNCGHGILIVTPLVFVIFFYRYLVLSHSLGRISLFTFLFSFFIYSLAYCEACITIIEDGVIKCQVCECRHPSGFPKVCKELDYVLEEQFSSEYSLRRSSTQLCQEQIQNGNPFKEANDQGFKFSYPTEENFLRWWTVHRSKFHTGVGCDMCGMCPIVGDRYRCKDCKESCGYDICGDCHNTGSKLPGRFNQKHTPQHQLELIKPVINRDVIYRLLSGQLAVVSAAARNQSNNPANGSSELASSSLDVDNGRDDDVDDHDHDDGGGLDPTESAIDSGGQSQN